MANQREHCLTCNYQNKPLFSPGCICQVVNKHDIARLHVEVRELEDRVRFLRFALVILAIWSMIELLT